MIVFKEDWYKYKHAVVDLTTKNRTFVDIAILFRDMGVEHWYFPLALHNPLLLGLSPYDDNLTSDQKIMMLREADVNPWWYLRELATDPKGGSSYEDKAFRANRGNIASMWLLLACIDYIQIQPRQTGKSFGNDTNTNWLEYFCYKDTDMNLITKDDKTRISNINRLKSIRDDWPSFMCRNTKYDDNNQSTTSCRMLGNKLFTHVSQSSEKAANNMGRGLTSPYLQIDEGPFIDHIQTVITAASGGTNTARSIAKRKGVPYATVITTTAGNIEDRDGAYMYDIWQSATIWNEIFYDCKNRDHLVSMILANGRSKTPIVNLTLSHSQLGFSDEWLYDSIQRARGSSSNIDKDYFNRWGSSSDNSILTKEVSDVIKASESDPKDLDISKDNYIWKWYQVMNPNVKHVLCVDTSNAIGIDDIGNVLISSHDGGVVGAAAVNDTNLHRYSQWLADFMIKNENVILVIENMYNAQVIIDYLLVVLPEAGIDPFRRIYNTIINDKENNLKDYSLITNTNAKRSQHIYDLHKDKFGFKANSGTRKFLYGTVLKNAAEDAGDKIRDRQLSNQILCLKNKNGRIDHGVGGHDDMVIAWLLGHWFLNYASNLYFYGIVAKDVMVDRSVKGKKQTSKDILETQLQNTLKEKVDMLTDRLEKTTHHMEVMKIEAQLESLKSKLKENTLASDMTIEQIIQNAKDKRNSRFNNANVDGRRYNSAKLLMSSFG